MFRRILDYSNKNPWLYAVYVVLVGLPTVLIVTFCCSGSGEKQGQWILVVRLLVLEIYSKWLFSCFDPQNIA